MGVSYMHRLMLALRVRALESFSGLKSERGQGLVEYSLIVVLISLTAIAAMGSLGDKVNKAFTLAASAFR